MSLRRSASSASSSSSSTGLHVEIYEPFDGQMTGPTVVFCHGFGGSARNFRLQVRALRESVRFVLYDARGHARSARKQVTMADCIIDMQTLVGDLENVIAVHGDRQVILAGLSMGAATALLYALECPQRVSGILLAAYPNPSNRFRSWALDFALSIERLGLDRAGETFVWGEAVRGEQSAKYLIRQGFLEHSELALAAILRDTLATLQTIAELESRLREVRIPTRIVVGADDAMSIEPCRQLARLIPNANLSVLEGAGHVVNLERVPEFNEELRKLVFQVNQ